MFRHEIPWDVSGEEAERMLGEIRKIEPDAYLEITFTIKHSNPDKYEDIETALCDPSIVDL